MIITIGSKNKAKVDAVQSVFEGETIKALAVSSHVSSQPFSDQETLTGAINRAMEVHKHEPNGLAIGLEGGVMWLNTQLFLCNWGALVDQNKNVYIASGARVPLPTEIVMQLEAGRELGDIMESYAKNRDVRHNEGAIGILTNDLVSRKSMFVHVLQQLKGQYQVQLEQD